MGLKVQKAVTAIRPMVYLKRFLIELEPWLGGALLITLVLGIHRSWPDAASIIVLGVVQAAYNTWRAWWETPIFPVE